MVGAYKNIFGYPLSLSFIKVLRDFNAPTHSGIDLDTLVPDSPRTVYSIGDGTVVEVNSSISYGKYIVVGHGIKDIYGIKRKYFSLYAHLSPDIKVHVGESVIGTNNCSFREAPTQPATVLGYVDVEGSYPYLHFEVRLDENLQDNSIDPREILDFPACIDRRQY